MHAFLKLVRLLIFYPILLLFTLLDYFFWKGTTCCSIFSTIVFFVHALFASFNLSSELPTFTRLLKILLVAKYPALAMTTNLSLFLPPSLPPSVSSVDYVRQHVGFEEDLTRRRTDLEKAFISEQRE